MARYAVTLTDDEIQDLKAIIQKGGKGYRIKYWLEAKKRSLSYGKGGGRFYSL